MDPTDIVALFERWAESKGLLLTLTKADGRRYLWDQTEWRWQGFLAAYECS